MSLSGLLLQSVPYLAGRHILKVFTPELGLLSVMAKKTTPSIATTPFVWAEWVLAQTTREIYPLKDVSLLDPFSEIKENYPRLIAAGRIAHDLLRTQMPGKQAVEIFSLALACLQKLSLFAHPHLLSASFRLKLLSHEGLLHPNDLPSHILQTLAYSRSFKELSMLAAEETDLQQVNLLFETRLDFPPPLT